MVVSGPGPSFLGCEIYLFCFQQLIEVSGILDVLLDVRNNVTISSSLLSSAATVTSAPGA
jgi:hypothetical protein